MTTTIKSIKQASEDSGIPASLIRAVIRQLGGTDNVIDVYNHGAGAGFSGFTYYTDTNAFFRRNRTAIVALVKRMAEDIGEDAVSMVAGFRCLKTSDHALNLELRDDIGRAIYGAKVRDDGFPVENALAWFALEEVCRAMVNE